MNEKYDPAPEHLSKDPFKKESSISSIKMVDMGVSQTRNRASSNYLANLMQIKEVIEDDNLQISKEYIPADQGKMVRSNTILIEKYQGKKKKGNKDKKKKGSILKASSKKLPQQSQEGNPFGQTGDILSINDVVPSLKDPTDPDIVPEIAEEEPEEFTIQDKIAQEEEAGLLVQFRVSEAHAHELEINVDSLIAAIDKTCDNISNTSTNSKAEIEEYQTEIKDMKEKLLRAIEEKDVHIKNCEVIYGKLSTVRKRMYADKPQAELERVRDLIVNKGLMIAETLRVEMAKLENVFWDMKCSEEKNFLAIRLKWLRRMIRGARKLLSEVCQCPTKDLIPAEKEYELSMISEILPQKLNSMVEKEATLEEKALKVSNLAEKKVFQDQLHDYRLMLDHIYFTCFRSNRKSRLSKRPYFSMKPDVNTTESDKMDITMDEEGPYVIDHDAIFHNLHCLRTNQTYVNLKRKSLEFEMNLMNPNMFMIQKMITGDEKVLNRSDNAIGKRGRQVAETYLALVKLQKVDVKERDFKDTMKHSLSNLQIDSDVNNIGDIISYFLTQDGKVFSLF